MKLGLFVLALLLAGCVTPPSDPSATSPGAGARDGPAAAATDLLLPGPAAGGEPSVAIAPDGSAVYVVVPAYGNGNENQNRLWKSHDGGRDWIYVGPVPNGGVGTNDADVTVRPDGSVWVAAMWVTGPQGATDPLYDAFATKCTSVSSSKDQGQTWIVAPLACGTSPFDDERPWLASDETTTYLLRYQWLRAPGTGSATAGLLPPALSSTTDNAAWLDHPAAQAPGGFFSRPVATRAGVLFANFPKSMDDGWFHGPVFETTTDGGLTWDATPIANERADTRSPGLGVAGDGRALATWIPVDDHGSQVRATLRDASGRWSPPFSLDANGTNVMAWADGNGGHLAAAWLHTDEAAHPCDVNDSAEWRVRVWLDGNVATAPFVVHRGPLFDAFSKDCEKDRNLGDFMTAAVAKDGTVLVATAEDTTPGVQYGRAPIHVIVVPPR